MRLGEKSSAANGGRVLLVAPIPPPYGGMALQAKLLERLLQKEGTEVHLLGYNQSCSRFSFIERILVLRTIVRVVLFCGRFWRLARNVDVVHILAASWLYFFAVVSPAVVMARLRRKRVVLNYRAGNADEFFRSCGWLARPIFRMAQITTVPSGFLAEVIRRRIRVPVTVVPNVVNFSLFETRQRQSFTPKLLVTRHLEEIYDVESVVRAFREVQSRYPEASLWIAGTGGQEERLRKLVAEWELRNVRFLGYVDHKMLAPIYDQCDILINASRVDNFPGSLMEGSAAGLAIVSTKAGGIPYVYEHCKNALLVDVGDWKELAVAVERVIQDPELGRRLTSAGAEVCRQCEWTRVRENLSAVYGFQIADGSDVEVRDGEFALGD